MSEPVHLSIRAHVEGCPKALSVPVDLCDCGGRDFVPLDEIARLRNVNQRLNRRAQLAEAAANLRLEDYEKRSTGQMRTYIYSLAQCDRAELQALRTIQTALRALLEQWETRKAHQKQEIQRLRGTPASDEAIGRFEEIVSCVKELSAVLLSLSPEEKP